MGKIFISVVLIFMTLYANADVFTADTVCTWTPWDIKYTDRRNNWFSECDGQSVTGVALCSSQSADVGDVSRKQPTIDASENRNENNIHCWCKMTSPYEGLWVYHGVYGMTEDYCDGSSSTALFNGICSTHCAYLWLVKNSGNSYLDNYMYGFNGTAEELLAIKAGLFTPMPDEILCEIGVSRLMLSTGASFQLYAEKYTERALVVQYNDQKCYGKLEAGRGILNIQVDGAVYHLVE